MLVNCLPTDTVFYPDASVYMDIAVKTQVSLNDSSLSTGYIISCQYYLL